MRPRHAALALLLLLTGCCHTLVVVQWGIGNKSAASLAPMTPEAYCMALISPNISLKKLPPTATTEQKQFCQDLLQHPPTPQTKPSKEDADASSSKDKK